MEKIVLGTGMDQQLRVIIAFVKDPHLSQAPKMWLAIVYNSASWGPGTSFDLHE